MEHVELGLLNEVVSYSACCASSRHPLHKISPPAHHKNHYNLYLYYSLTKTTRSTLLKNQRRRPDQETRVNYSKIHLTLVRTKERSVLKYSQLSCCLGNVFKMAFMWQHYLEIMQHINHPPDFSFNRHVQPSSFSLFLSIKTI